MNTPLPEALVALQSTEPGLRVPGQVVNFNLGGATVTLPPAAAN